MISSTKYKEIVRVMKVMKASTKKIGIVLGKEKIMKSS